MLAVQAPWGCQFAPSRSMAFSVVIILRMTATMMTLGFLPAEASDGGGSVRLAGFGRQAGAQVELAPLERQQVAALQHCPLGDRDFLTATAHRSQVQATRPISACTLLSVARSALAYQPRKPVSDATVLSHMGELARRY